MSKIAVVVGGSGAIGMACVSRLVADGFTVAATFNTTLPPEEGQVFWVHCDVTDKDSVEAAFTAIEERYEGMVAVLVYNAGINKDNLSLRMSDEEWDTVLATNLSGARRVIRRATLGMMRARWGRVVLMGSVVAFSGSPGQINYGAAKAGLVGLARSLVRELASRGITINVVAPGPITSAMTDALKPEIRKHFISLVPSARFGTGEEVADAVAWLCGEGAAYVNGAVIPVDGGMGMGH